LFLLSGIIHVFCLFACPLFRGNITEREFARYDLSAAGDDLAYLKQIIESQSEAIGLRRKPKLVVSSDERLLKPYSFGTFRRWYLALNHEVAQKTQENLTDPDVAPSAEAQLIHALYHFHIGDHWQMGYARELLHNTFWLMIGICGLGFLVLIAVPDLIHSDLCEQFNQIESLAPEMREIIVRTLPLQTELDQMCRKLAKTNPRLVLSSIISIILAIVITGLLRTFFWPKLWRMRELYADVGVVHIRGEAGSFLSVLTEIPLHLVKQYPNIMGGFKIQKITHRTRDWRQKVQEMISLHPDAITRVRCIRDPSQVFDYSFITASQVGSLALLLDILLSSSMTRFYVGGWSMHFSALAIIVIVALGLIPSLVQGKSVRAGLAKFIAFIMTMRLGWRFIISSFMVVLSITDPNVLDQILPSTITNAVQLIGFSDESGFNNLTAFVVNAAVLNFIQVLIITVVLAGSLSLIVFLLRRMLTWYRMPQVNERLMKIAYGIIVFIASCMGLIVLPLLTEILLNPNNLLNPANIGIEILGVIVTVIALLLFIKTDKQYAKRCPLCNSDVEGAFMIGKCCRTCGALLHPWLISEV
jgi:hypothetical protein